MLIITKFCPAGDVRGSRISAHAPGWNLPRVYIPYPHEKSGVECHADAARALIKKAGLMQKNLIYLYQSIPGGYCFISRDDGPFINLGE